jgi:hypothetical protein
MAAPGFFADATLYTSTRHYRTGKPSASARGIQLFAAIEAVEIGQPVGFPPLMPVGPPPCNDWSACINEAEHTRNLCFTKCAPCTEQDARNCFLDHQQNVQECLSAYGCPTGTTCSGDAHISNPWGYYCCPSGTVACRGQCVKNLCGPGAWFDRRLCGCFCPKLCAPPLVLNADKCECECPAQTCPANKILDPLTCQCTCPAGLTDCNGICVDPDISPTNCGSCGNVCIQGREACCNGVCRLLTTTENCGFCGNACQEDQDCCNRVCTWLNTIKNCGACGRKCDPGEQCRMGQCVCPSGRVKCGNICCPTGQDCCSGKCTNTQNDPQHCGRCNNPVQLGWGCCNGIPRDLQNDVQNCGECRNACFYSLGAGWGTCQAGLCRCPAGFVAVRWDAKGDLSCCPVNTPFPCSNGTCGTAANC